MDRKILIEYSWWKEQGFEPPTDEHREALEEDAQSRIFEMMADDYTSGELNTTVRVSEADGEEGVAYRGSWSAQELDLDLALKTVASASADDITNAMSQLARTLSPVQREHFAQAMVGTGIDEDVLSARDADPDDLSP